MKKIILTTVVIVLIYLVLVAILNLSGVCPGYVDFMPRDPSASDPNGPKGWHIFCPFADKVE